jgi:uncharacterized protein YutE (UPF0331/DUF86 family)
MDDVLVAKAAVVERCLARVEEEYAGDPANLRNFTRQDAIVLNLQRACEACIDIASRVILLRRLGVPTSSRDAFAVLEREGLLEAELGRPLQRMVGFRNVAVHAYESLELDVVRGIVEHELATLRAFARWAVAFPA